MMLNVKCSAGELPLMHTNGYFCSECGEKSLPLVQRLLRRAFRRSAVSVFSQCYGFCSPGRLSAVGLGEQSPRHAFSQSDGWSKCRDPAVPAAAKSVIFTSKVLCIQFRLDFS